MLVPTLSTVGLTPCTKKDGAYQQLLARTWPKSRKEYLLLKEVGRGATAEVWVAQCKNFSTLIAVKIFHLDRIPGDKGIARREIEMMSRFCHNAILPVLTSFHDGEDMWMLMPYVSGGAVSSILHHRHPTGLQEPAIAAVATGVLSALSCLHQAGVMHRDIKGANVLVSDKGLVFLVDFGLACSFDDASSTHAAAASIAIKLQGEAVVAAAAAEVGASRSTLVGTTAFMAPEVINAGHDVECYDQRADVWSFGILLLEMAHGEPPHAHSSLEETAVRVVSYSPPKLEQPSDGRIFSEDFIDICSRCLVKDVSCRPTVESLLAHPFIQRNAAESADLARLLFGMTEDNSDKAALKSSPSLKDLAVPETVPSRMAYAAAHALKILDKALSREAALEQREYKYPRLHRLAFDSRLRREDLLNCKAVLFGKAKRSGGLVTSVAVGRAFVMARQTAEDGSVFWSAPLFITISGHGLGLSIGKQELGFIMVMQSTEALMDSQPMMVRGHGTFSRSTLGKGSGGQTMVGSLGTSLKMFHFAEGYMADVTAIGWQLDANIEMNSAMYGADLAGASSILGGKVRPPPQFDDLISALTAAEEAPEDSLTDALD